MNETYSKVYYEKSTGSVLVITSECQDAVKATTKEEYINIYIN